MYDVFYKVVFQGDVLPGHEKEAVQTRLAGLFHVNAQDAAKLFSGKQHKVKSNLDLESAKKYAKALAKLGALGYIEQEIIEHAEEQVAGAEEQVVEPTDVSETEFTETGSFVTETGSFDVSAVRAYFESQDQKKQETEKTADHSIISLDELEDVIEAQEEQDPTGVHHVLDADAIAKMLNSK